GDKTAVNAAFARAAHVAALDLTVSRVSANSMEARNAIGAHDERDGRYTLYAGAQAPHTLRAELAGAILKIPQDRLRVVSPDLGATLAMMGVHCTTGNLGGLAGTYRTPHIHATVTGIFSNTNPTAPYRGAGRPEASHAIERVIDVAAREMAIDRAELRRRNLI